MKNFTCKATKLCFLILMILLFRNTNAQVDSLRLTLDNIFAHIDKSQVPTGFLKEYGAEFVNLPRFNGILTDSNYVNAIAWNYIYASV